MKKLLFMIMSMLMIAVCYFGGCSGEMQTDSFFEFRAIGTGYEVSVKQGVMLEGRVEIPAMYEGINVVSVSGFRYQENITEVVIPSSVEVIVGGAFLFCKNLTDVVIPDGLKEIGGFAFAGCESLEYLFIPESVVEIGVAAFGDCKSLKSFTIPGFLASDGKSLFGGSGIETVYIKSTPVNVEAAWFTGANSLKKIIVSDEHEQVMSKDGVLYSKDGKTLIVYPAGKAGESVEIPEGVHTVGSHALPMTENIREFVFPSSVRVIENQDFPDSIERFVVKSVIPPKIDSITMIEYALDGTMVKFYVPAESVEAYKKADGWKYFADYIFAIEE